MEYLYQMSLFVPTLKANFLTSFKHFLTFGDALLDKVLAASGHLTLNNIEVEGREPVQACIDKGQGFVLLTAHLGNMEVSRILAKYRKIPLNILVHTRHAEKFNRVLRRLDPQCQVNLIQVTELNTSLAISLSQKVQAGEGVVIAADRIPASGNMNHMVPADFLGRTAYFPIGPYVLSHLLQVPVFFVTCVRKQKSYHIQYELFETCISISRSSREESLRIYAQKFAHLLAVRCKQTPLQWYNFYPFWHADL
ncbi:hypothetical protein [Hydromonas duriensis]|nr:hypothetical protein [Hydromonas duriensis]